LRDKRFGLVASRYNPEVTEGLLAGARDALRAWGIPDRRLRVTRVAGAFEIPRAARRLAETGMNAVVCVGAVIRGETPHFEYICREVSRGVAELSLHGAIPVTFGVLTTDTLEQALARAGGDKGNKGAEAADAAVRMVVMEANLTVDEGGAEDGEAEE